MAERPAILVNVPLRPAGRVGTHAATPSHRDSNFGVGRRESHVADAFYARFEAPELSADEQVTPHDPGVTCVCGDARTMVDLADDSVALVVTSPPYFAGKQYEEELDREGVPGSYLEYLALLRDVFAECKRVLERAAASRSTWRTSAASPTAASPPT